MSKPVAKYPKASDYFQPATTVPDIQGRSTTYKLDDKVTLKPSALGQVPANQRDLVHSQAVITNLPGCHPEKLGCYEIAFENGHIDYFPATALETIHRANSKR